MEIGTTVIGNFIPRSKNETLRYFIGEIISFKNGIGDISDTPVIRLTDGQEVTGDQCLWREARVPFHESILSFLMPCRHLKDGVLVMSLFGTAIPSCHDKIVGALKSLINNGTDPNYKALVEKTVEWVKLEKEHVEGWDEL